MINQSPLLLKFHKRWGIADPLESTSYFRDLLNAVLALLIASSRSTPHAILIAVPAVPIRRRSSGLVHRSRCTGSFRQERGAPNWSADDSPLYPAPDTV